MHYMSHVRYSLLHCHAALHRMPYMHTHYIARPSRTRLRSVLVLHMPR
jgi:hypothetical protein